MSSGTGGPLDDLLNVATQISSFGLVGFGDKGVKKGVVSDVGIKGVKDITGATAAEEANQMARDQFEQQTAATKQDRLNAQTANKNANIAASNGVGAMRSTGTKNNKSSSANIGDVKDFLGI